MEIKIRKMQEEDAMTIAAMNQLLSHSEEKATRADAQFFCDHALGPRRLANIWVATDDQAIAGFMATRDWASFGGKAKVRQIDLLYIDEEYRGLGIAADLLAFVTQDAFAHGCGRVDIQTEAGNEDSNALYKKFGFKTTPDTRNHYRLLAEQAENMPDGAIPLSS